MADMRAHVKNLDVYSAEMFDVFKEYIPKLADVFPKLQSVFLERGDYECFSQAVRLYNNLVYRASQLMVSRKEIAEFIDKWEKRFGSE